MRDSRADFNEAACKGNFAAQACVDPPSERLEIRVVVARDNAAMCHPALVKVQEVFAIQRQDRPLQPRREFEHDFVRYPAIAHCGVTGRQHVVPQRAKALGYR